MENWKVYAKKADFKAIGKRYNIDPVVARIIRNRDYVTESELDMFFSEDISRLHDPWLLKDMDKAIRIVEAKISQGKKVRIIGDYDIDGICSIFILMTALKNVGANVDYAVPHRVHDGYGINENLIDMAKNDGIDTIITCDNGIAAINAVTHAKELGMTVVVTDHHNIPFKMENECKIYTLPDADAIIDPKQEMCEYPYKEICGGYVAYKFACCLYETFGKKGLEANLLKYAAIATIGDIMPLRDENRILVKKGLRDLDITEDTGLRALKRACSIDGKRISAYDIGFRLGPCLNASGRLESAVYAVDLLLEEDGDKAYKLAEKLKELNDERKDMTEKCAKNAIDTIENSPMSQDKILVVYLPECHESVAGIVAGRVRERFNKPTIIITDSENICKGSGRSIEKYDMFDELTKVKELFEKFGGHKMAAGLSLKRENIEILRMRLNENTTLIEEDFVRTIMIDVPMPVSYITENLIKDLECLEPFGNGNEKPVFAENHLLVKNMKVIGKNSNVVKMKLINERGCAIDALYFGDVKEFCERVHENLRYAFSYYPSVNEYMGNKTLQVTITGVRQETA